MIYIYHIYILYIDRTEFSITFHSTLTIVLGNMLGAILRPKVTDKICISRG